jgi:hypothetical protein
LDSAAIGRVICSGWWDFAVNADQVHGIGATHRVNPVLVIALAKVTFLVRRALAAFVTNTGTNVDIVAPSNASNSSTTTRRSISAGTAGKRTASSATTWSTSDEFRICPLPAPSGIDSRVDPVLILVLRSSHREPLSWASCV